MRQFYIFTNSPGEVFAWAQPLCDRLSQEFDSIDIYIFLTPCQYATGEEARVAAAFSGVTRVFHPKETVKMLLFKSLDFKPGTVFLWGVTRSIQSVSHLELNPIWLGILIILLPIWMGLIMCFQNQKHLI